MVKYLSKKLAQSIFTLFIVISIVFLLMRLMPEEGYFGQGYDKLAPAQRENILRNLGLRDPWYIQLTHFYKNLFKGNLGTSITYRPNVPVAEIIGPKITYSLYFGMAALAISIVAGIALGILMAKSKNKLWDKLGNGYIVFINAVPAAVYYLFIQLYATGILKLPILFDKDDPSSWILPVLSMALSSTAGYAMWMRRYMVDEMNKDYIKLARAKGLSSSQIMVKHVLKNAIVPMAQYFPTSLLYTVAGSIYIESLYSIPGMGGLLVDTIQRQDNSIVQILVLIYSSLGIIGLFLGDILMAAIDPRIKLAKQGGTR